MGNSNYNADQFVGLPGFDDRGGDLVDVFSSEEGEFVQVWNVRRNGNMDSLGRVVLAYLRTEYGPICIKRTFLLEGEYAWVSVEGPLRTFKYRDAPEYQRIEVDLPSGRVIVDDPRKGAIIVEIWTKDFNWQRSQPIGDRLSNKDILRLQKTGDHWFKTTFQEIYAKTQLYSRDLVRVETYLGSVLKETTEFQVGIPYIKVEYTRLQK